jgi:hypothetical protein
MVSLHHEAVHAMKIEFIDLPAEMEMTRRNYLGYHVPVRGTALKRSVSETKNQSD